jgi:pyruvate kinase
VGGSSERDEALRQAEQQLKVRGRLQAGDRYVITAGQPMGTPGGTNMLQVCQVA